MYLPLVLNPLWLVLYIGSQAFSFGALNDAKLDALDFDFKSRMVLFLWSVKLFEGLDVLVVQTRRTAAEQAALHRQNPKNPLNPGDHGSGHAADLNFLRAGRSALVKASPAAAWAKVYALAEFFGISNGHAFAGYADNNHFFIRY